MRDAAAPVRETVSLPVERLSRAFDTPLRSLDAPLDLRQAAGAMRALHRHFEAKLAAALRHADRTIDRRPPARADARLKATIAAASFRKEFDGGRFPLRNPTHPGVIPSQSPHRRRAPLPSNRLSVAAFVRGMAQFGSQREPGHRRAVLAAEPNHDVHRFGAQARSKLRLHPTSALSGPRGDQASDYIPHPEDRASARPRR